MRQHLWFAVALAVALAGWTVSAQAGFTTIKPPAGHEDSIGTVIDKLYGGYGGAFHADGLNYTNGLVTLLRVPDSPAGVVNINNFALNGGTDRRWKGNIVSALAYGHFSGADPAFGYINGSSGGTFHKLMSITADGVITPIVSASDSLNQTFRWAIKIGNRVISSKPADNKNSKDRMVSYEVLNYNHESTPRWLLFFEDGKDFDFNDLVVEVESGAPRALVTIPEPGTMLVWLGLAGAAMVWWRRR